MHVVFAESADKGKIITIGFPKRERGAWLELWASAVAQMHIVHKLQGHRNPKLVRELNATHAEQVSTCQRGTHACRLASRSASVYLALGMRETRPCTLISCHSNLRRPSRKPARSHRGCPCAGLPDRPAALPSQPLRAVSLTARVTAAPGRQPSPRRETW